MSASDMIVSVGMITYNHADYIEEAINGILMQKTTFEFELVISNDNSTDGTGDVIQNIINTHPMAYRIRYYNNKVNLGIASNLIDNINKCKGKYYALCEGDDYWTDPNKLQLQVDFLDSNPGFSFCCHRYKIYSEFNKQFDKEISPLGFYETEVKNGGVVIDKNIYHKQWLTQPLTSMIRKVSLAEVIKLEPNFAHFRDVHLFYLLLNYGSGFCLEFVGGVYRKNAGGVFASANYKERYLVGLTIYKDLYLFSKDKRFIITYWIYAISLLIRRVNLSPILKSFVSKLTVSEKLFFAGSFFISFYKITIIKLKLTCNKLLKNTVVKIVLFISLLNVM